jgi:peptide/nickel transport system permease protein
MIKYVGKRLMGLIPIFIGITMITFAVTELAPGDPTDLQTDLNPKISVEAKQKILEYYGLDKPLWQRYVNWVTGIATLDLGRSFKDGEKVITKIGRRIPITLVINILAMILIFLIAIPLGVLGAVKEGAWLDQVLTVIVFIGFSVPTFWLALLLMSYFGITLNWLPVSGLHSMDYEYFGAWDQCVDLARHLILPIAVSALTGFSGIQRFMRTSMLEVIHMDYIKTARSKGLPERVVLYKHAFRNAVLPIVTILGLSVPGLLGGSVIFETIFSIPGMGKLMYDSIMARDMPVYMAILVIGAVLTLLGNLLADLAYRWVDPRIRYET